MLTRNLLHVKLSSIRLNWLVRARQRTAKHLASNSKRKSSLGLRCLCHSNEYVSGKHCFKSVLGVWRPGNSCWDGIGPWVNWSSPSLWQVHGQCLGLQRGHCLHERTLGAVKVIGSLSSIFRKYFSDDSVTKVQAQTQVRQPLLGGYPSSFCLLQVMWPPPPSIRASCLASSSLSFLTGKTRLIKPPPREAERIQRNTGCLGLVHTNYCF